jgi:hypothetical protein
MVMTSLLLSKHAISSFWFASLIETRSLTQLEMFSLLQLKTTAMPPPATSLVRCSSEACTAKDFVDISDWSHLIPCG